MKAREIVKAIMENTNITNATMAARLSLTPAALWDRLNTKKAKDIPVSTLNEMLKVLDYKIVIVPRETRVPTNGFTVE